MLPCVEDSTLSGESSIAYSVSEPLSDTCATAVERPHVGVPKLLVLGRPRNATASTSPVVATPMSVSTAGVKVRRAIVRMEETARSASSMFTPECL